MRTSEVAYTFSTAASMRRAASRSPTYWSIIAAERMSAVGLATPFPAMSGALPWTASKTAHSSPMLAPGTTPRPPTRPAVRSLRMSP